VPEPAPSVAPLVTGPGATQPPANGGGTVFPASTAGVGGGSSGGSGGGGWNGSSVGGANGSSRSIPHEGGGYRSGSQSPRDVGSDGESPFSNPVFDRFIATLARSNPAWLERILGMTRSGATGAAGWRSARSRSPRRGRFDRSAFQTMSGRLENRERSTTR
jgi:hypothetical protein